MRGLAIIVLACVGIAVPHSASGCVCVNEPVTVVVAKGRVFSLDGPSGAEAVPNAAVELRAIPEGKRVWATTTDANGGFELETPPPGEYSLRIALAGFKSTVIPVRIKKGRSDAPGRLAVRLDIPTDCSCGDACVSVPDRSGNVDAKCLQERRKLSLTQGEPPNNELQRTRPAPALRPRR